MTGMSGRSEQAFHVIHVLLRIVAGFPKSDIHVYRYVGFCFGNMQPVFGEIGYSIRFVLKRNAFSLEWFVVRKSNANKIRSGSRPGEHRFPITQGESEIMRMIRMD